MSIIDEIASGIETARKLLRGELTVEQLVDDACAPQGEASPALCGKGSCVLEQGHPGGCSPVKAVP